MAERARSFAEVHVDFGTGDGAFAYRTALRRPGNLVIGVDANADLMREISRRAGRKPARGGLPNLWFGRLPLEEAPGDLAQLADRLTILFPWGSLLRALAVPESGALRKLAALAKPDARVQFVYGYASGRNARAVDGLGLPRLGASSVLSTLEGAYANAGLDVQARYVSRDEIASIQSAWAKKLAFSGRDRVFVELEGRMGPVTGGNDCS